MADAPRARRLAKRIIQITATTLEHEVKDPRLAMVTITDARLTGDLREATVFYTVYGDDNARQASSEGQTIELQGHRLDGQYEFVVADRGHGLTEEARERLFEPFFTTRGEGAGLGLAVCYGLVTAHGGQLQARERPGGGLALHVTLPLVTEGA